MANKNNAEGYVLNTTSGILHTKECADGEAGFAAVAAGKRKHYSNYNNATNDDRYKKDHESEACIGK